MKGVKQTRYAFMITLSVAVIAVLLINVAYGYMSSVQSNGNSVSSDTHTIDILDNSGNPVTSPMSIHDFGYSDLVDGEGSYTFTNYKLGITFPNNGHPYIRAWSILSDPTAWVIIDYMELTIKDVNGNDVYIEASDKQVRNSASTIYVNDGGYREATQPEKENPAIVKYVKNCYEFGVSTDSKYVATASQIASCIFLDDQGNTVASKSDLQSNATKYIRSGNSFVAANSSEISSASILYVKDGGSYRLATASEVLNNGVTKYVNGEGTGIPTDPVQLSNGNHPFSVTIHFKNKLNLGSADFNSLVNAISNSKLVFVSNGEDPLSSS